MGDPADSRLNAGGGQALGRYHRGEEGVAHDVPNVCPRVTQHGQVPPGIPLVHKPGGHLAADVTEQLFGRLIPRLLVLGLEQVLRKVRVDLQVWCILSVLFLQFFLKVSHAPLHPVELPLRGHALEDTSGLYRLGGVSLMAHHFREHSHGGFEVSGVGRRIVQSPAGGRICLGYLALSHGLRPLRQGSGVALVPNCTLSVRDGGLIRVGLVGERPCGRQFLYVWNGGIRRHLGLQDGPHRLRDLPVVRCPAGDPDLPGRLLARLDRAVLLHHPLIYLVHQPTDFPPHLRFTPGPVLRLLHQAVDLAGELVGALKGEFYFFVSFSSNSGQFPPTNTLCGIRSGYFVQVIVPTALLLHLLHCLHAFFGMKLSNAIFCVLLHVDNRLSLCVLCHSFNNEVAPTREHNLALEIVPDTGHISPGLAGDDLRNGQLALHGVAVLCCGTGCIRFIRHNIALCVFRQKRVQRLLPLHVKGQPTIDCPFMYRQLLQGAVQIVHHLLLRLGKALAVPQLGVDLVAIATLVL